MRILPERFTDFIQEHPKAVRRTVIFGVSAFLINLGVDLNNNGQPKHEIAPQPGLPTENTGVETPAVELKKLPVFFPAGSSAHEEAAPEASETQKPIYIFPEVKASKAAQEETKSDQVEPAAKPVETQEKKTIFPTGMETSPGFSSYLLNNPIHRAADLVSYKQMVQETYATKELVSDFLFEQVLNGELDIIPGNTVEDFGHGFSEQLWLDLVPMEQRIDSTFTSESLSAARNEFEFQPLVFKDGAFEHPGALWNVDPETGVETFAYVAADYDNAQTVMVLAAAGRLENQMGSEAWSQLSQNEKTTQAVDLFRSWILETRESVAPGTPHRVITDENGKKLFELYFPEENGSFVTCRIEVQPGLDSRDDQEAGKFIREKVKIKFQPKNNLQANFFELSRNGDFLPIIIFDPATGQTRVEMWDLSTGFKFIPDGWQAPDGPFEESDLVMPMDSCGVDQPSVAPITPQPTPGQPPIIPPPPETCEERGDCPPPPPKTPEKPKGDGVNPDGEDEILPGGGLIEGEDNPPPTGSGY